MGRAASTESISSRSSSRQRALLRREVAPRDQHGLRLEQGLQLDEPVLAQRVAARDEVDDRVGRVQPRGELDRAAERDDAGGDAGALEPRGDRARIGRRDPAALEIGERGDRSALRDGQREPAAPEAELEQRLDVGAGLDDLVLAGDAEIDVAGGRPHRDVVRAREQEVEVEIVGVGVQRAARRLELDAGVGQQPRGGLGEPALGGQREPEQAAARHLRRRASRSSTSRYPPSPWRSQWATRVTVVVEPPTRSATSA